MKVIDGLLAELEQEAETTRRVLERVPQAHLSWRPHPKSMSLGQLALHVATTPGQGAAILSQDELELPELGNRPAAATAAELIPALDQSLVLAKGFLGALDEGKALSTWKLMKSGKVLMAVPRIGMVRSLMLNHWYHHRGQLSVYLRILNVPVPSIYGPSADENPFA